MRISTSAFVLACLATPGLAAAQETSDTQGAVSGALVYGRGAGPFARNVQLAIGLTLSAHRDAALRGRLGVGLEATYLYYGSDLNTRAHVGATTSQVLVLGVGSRLHSRFGPVEPYVSTSLGAAFFVTASTNRNSSTFLSPNGGGTEGGFFDHVDVAFPAATAGGGIRLRLTRGHRPVSLDLGARYQVTPAASYVTQGGAIDLPDGNSELATAESPTAFWLFTLGVAMRF